MHPKVCVIGAGVVGLSTAINIQNITDADVTIIADKFTTETLSDGSPGLFRPSSNIFGPFKDSVRKWSEDSYSYYKAMSKENSEAAGIKEISGYLLSKKYKEITESPLLESLLSDWQILDNSEISKFPGQWKYGVKFTTLIVECRRYLPWMMTRFLNGGGTILKKHINSIEELIGQYDIIVNCTGFNAKYLCNDNHVIPIRGQVYKVRAPWVKNFYYGDFDTFIIPGFDTVTLGGTRQYDSFNEERDPFDSRSIWERCCQLLPSLKDAVIEREFVGLRPHRSSIRLEVETMKFGSKQIKVVHNYGHGGSGVALAWGSGKNAAELVQTELQNLKRNIYAKL